MTYEQRAREAIEPRARFDFPSTIFTGNPDDEAPKWLDAIIESHRPGGVFSPEGDIFLPKKFVVELISSLLAAEYQRNDEMRKDIVHAKAALMIGMIFLREMNENQEYSSTLDSLQTVIEILEGKHHTPPPQSPEKENV